MNVHINYLAGPDVNAANPTPNFHDAREIRAAFALSMTPIFAGTRQAADLLKHATCGAYEMGCDAYPIDRMPAFFRDVPMLARSWRCGFRESEFMHLCPADML
ncbi:hypothetical protein DF134_36530 [Burkholderia stagnalis]|uniref:hypothetical protein n=1 Tax=Burkholderia stagnalis TaxID=1503054 RepID=UPI000F5B10F5|nr:hypothetical protein [Burkholderia stagnalis]RQQ77823.1 hypothetical protein DF134_36530 [Burkholderia stagnalis]